MFSEHVYASGIMLITKTYTCTRLLLRTVCRSLVFDWEYSFIKNC